MPLLENLRIAFHAIKGQMLRTILTVLIIAIGIMALVGILTAIEGLKASINNNFTSMGANTFTIRNSGIGIRIGNTGKKPKRFQPITLQQAIKFKERMIYPGTISLSTFCNGVAVCRYGSEKTNPNIMVTGVDENYLLTGGYEIASGRNMTQTEAMRGDNVVVIGKEIKDKLFKNADAVEKDISIDNRRYRIIGVLKEKGSSMGFGGDKVCLIPLINGKQNYGNDGRSWTISVKVGNVAQLETAVEEAIGIFRIIRNDKIGEDKSFEIIKSDSIAAIVIDQLKNVSYAATIIGIITLLGAAIALMNIMLVSVTERTREIGIRKSLGATSLVILKQFLIEAIVICLFGGICGVILGVAVGNLMGMAMNAVFVIPWNWMGAGLTLCFIIGVISGFYPAMKASKLDPIEALRYE
ncbi:MAG: ABC transporter permease [Bacteroidetes bacterium]|jgi:putative ABC transport system permease protein|nr:ABC transporter permease [Bacteroidota bacterium]